jgi:hypothetical protein
MRKNFKGQIGFGMEVLMIAIVVMILSVVAIVLTQASTMLGGILKNNTVVNNPNYIIPGEPNAYNAYLSVASNYYNFDYYIPFIFYALEIIVVILAGWLNSNPIGFVVGFCVLIFLFTFSSFLISNTAYTILTNNALSGTASQFPNILNLLANLGIYDWAFMILYLISIAVRNVYFKSEQNVQTPFNNWGN